MNVNEHLGMRSIGSKLALDGILNKNGKPFSQSTIKYILTNPKYKGYYCGNKTRVIDYHTKQRVSINEEKLKKQSDEIVNSIHKLETKSKSVLNNYKYLEEVR